MSYYEEREARRRGERDFERCNWDYARWHDNSSEGRAYRSGYEQARESREEEDRAERLRWTLQHEARQRQVQIAMQEEQERFAREHAEAQEEEQEPFPEPDPMIEAIEQAVTEYQNNLADNVP